MDFTITNGIRWCIFVHILRVITINVVQLKSAGWRININDSHGSKVCKERVKTKMYFIRTFYNWEPVKVKKNINCIRIIWFP